MTTPDRPAAPSGLGKAGRALWRAVVADFEFGPHEAPVLAAACRQADAVADLEAVVAVEGVTSRGSAGQPVVHPALIEARQGRLALSRLLADLRIPAEDDQAADKRTSDAAKRAAAARWATPRPKRAG